MPRKKGKKNITNKDFTINDCANAPKPIRKVKKSSIPETFPLKSWEDLQDDDYDVETLSTDDNGFVCIKKKHSINNIHIDKRPGNVYPEIIWYLISPHIKPECIGCFARINKATYAVTKRESFWRSLYLKYCKDHPCLPEKLQIENSYVVYGLQQRVIRALYCTYKIFFLRTCQPVDDSSPHKLMNRRCVNVWYYKARTNWLLFFKFRRQCAQKRLAIDKIDFIEELGRIDANPDEDCQVLQVTCQSLNEVPPLMGMALSSVNVSLSQGLVHQRLHLGFNSGIYNSSTKLVPECSVIIDTVLNMSIYDWWHPKYPHSDNKLPSIMKDEELSPLLRKDFFLS